MALPHLHLLCPGPHLPSPTCSAWTSAYNLPALPPAAVSYSWAISSYPGFGIHDSAGGFSLNLASGSVATTTSKLPQWVLAHAIMMSISWILLLPSGILMVRHRWVYPQAKIGAKATW